MILARHRPPSRRTLVRRLVAWCVLIAIPLYGLGSSIDALLGPVHIHVAAAVNDDPMAGWQDFRRVDHVHEGAPSVHFHDAFGRHRHPVNDHSVVKLGASHQDDGGTSDGAPLSVLTFGSAPAELHITGTCEPSAAAGWQSHRLALFKSCDSRRLDRPPSVNDLHLLQVGIF